MKANIIVLLSLFTFGLLMNACEEDPLGMFSDDPRDGLKGAWNVTENSSLFKKSANGYYRVVITKDDSDTSKIYISNFYSLNDAKPTGEVKIAAYLDGRNLSIPEQTAKGYTIKGSGLVSFAFDKIEWSYTVLIDTGDRDDCTATYTRP